MKRQHEARKVIDLGVASRETKGVGIYSTDGVGKLPNGLSRD